MRIFPGVFVMACWLLPVREAFAQNDTFLNFRYADGFDNSQLMDMTEDEFGVLWFVGLTGSLYTYDGYEFRKFPLPPHTFTNNIYRISASINGHVIYLVTDLGILKFDGNDFQVIEGTKRDDWSYQTKLRRGGDGELWLLDKRGKLFVLKDDKLTQIRTDDGALSWIDNTPTGGIDIFGLDGMRATIERHAQLNTRVALPLGDKVSVKAVIHKNDSLYAFCSDGIYKVVGDKVEKITDHAFGNIRNVRVTRDGNVWILSQLKLFRLRGRSLTRIDADHGLTNNHVIQIDTDRNGTLWVLSDNEGIFQYRVKPFQLLSLPGNPTVSTVLPVTEDSVYISTFGQGVFIKGKHGVYQSKVFDPMKGLLLIGIVPYRGGILFGSDGNGLFYFKGGKLTALPYPAGAEFVRCLVSLPEILVGTQAGLFTLKDFRLKPIDQKHKYVNCIRTSSTGEVMVGTQHEGMFRLDNNGEMIPWDDGFYRSTSINFFTVDSLGNTWVSSNRDHISIYAPDFTLRQRIRLPASVGSVTSLDIIGENKIILSGDDNFYLLVTGEDWAIKTLEPFSKTDGVTPGELVLGGAFKKDNVIWYSSTSGAYRLDIDHIIPENNDLPTVFITNVGTQMGDSARENNLRRAGLYQLPASLALDHDHNTISFEYRATHFANPDRLHYRYRLTPLQSDWSPFSKKDRKITFTNLDPGDYVFEVQARAGNNGMSSAIAPYKFTVLPAYWQTLPFKLVMGLIALVLIVVTYLLLSQRRINRYKREERIRQQEASRIRQQMSMDFHDELGNKLAGILSYAAALRVQGKDEGAHLQYIESSAQAVYHGTRDFIWSINLESNNLQEILIYLRDFGASFFEKHGIHFDFEADLQDPIVNHILPEGYNRHIVLIFKEAMTNAFKHSKCTTVTLGALVKERSVTMFLKDNGEGIRHGMAGGNGIRNMTTRARKINSALNVFGGESGTMVQLVFKLR